MTVASAWSMGMPLVLLHFFGSSRREWDGVAAMFDGLRPVLALDLPGFGDAADLGAASVSAMADFVDARITEAGLVDCVVVGHSMSGKVAAVLAARAPSSLRALVLVAASPPAPEPMGDEAREKLLACDGSRAAAADFVDGSTAERLPDAPRDLAIADAMRASPAAWTAWASLGSREDWASRVGRLSLPTLVIAGSADEALGEDVQRKVVLPHFVDARLAVIDGGHLLPLENPKALHREIDAFVRNLEGAA